MRHLVVPLVATALLGATPAAARAQSVLDRPDNLSTDWVGQSGTLYFNFVHRFSSSPPPERKVTNFPTFLMAAGVGSRGLVGVNYATNSDVAARYPNEYELFGRWALLQQEEGAAFDLAGQADYNVAVKGMDGEVTLARRQGPLRLVAVGRAIADTLGGDRTRLALGGGGTLRFGRFLALAADVSALSDRMPGERAAWSAGVHVALPNTPHSLSLHVSNATTSTLQGLARGGDVRRYGFEFTIPVHLSRFFGDPAVVPPATPATVGTPAPVAGTAPRNDTGATPVAMAVATPVATPTASAPVPVTGVGAQASRTDSVPPAPSLARAEPRTARPATRPVSRPAAQKVVVARMKNQAYLPQRLEVDAGTTVQWKNLDALIHTVTAVDRSFDSGIIAADGSYSHTFTKPGTYPLFCVAHPFMKATVTVK